MPSVAEMAAALAAAPAHGVLIRGAQRFGALVSGGSLLPPESSGANYCRSSLRGRPRRGGRPACRRKPDATCKDLSASGHVLTQVDPRFVAYGSPPGLAPPCEPDPKISKRPTLGPFDRLLRGGLSPEKLVSYSRLAFDLPELACGSRCSLGEFVRRSLHPTDQVAITASDDVWPLPPPPALAWSGEPALSGRRRGRFQQRLAARELTRLAVCALNWETLGYPLSPPPSACSGAVCSPSQEQHIARIERLCRQSVRLGHGSGCDLGRALDKLGQAETSLTLLTRASNFLEQVFDSSAGIAGGFRSGEVADFRAHLEAADSSGNLPDVDRTPEGGVRQVDASRIKWKYGPTFDPLPFLSDPHLKGIYLDPEINRTDESSWEPARKVKVHATKEELCRVFKLWDDVGHLKLLDLDDLLRRGLLRTEELVGMFPVYKDANIDRLILNPTVRNGRSACSSHYTKLLGQGYMLTRLRLKRGWDLLISGDDLREFYSCFIATEARTRRNAVGSVMRGRDFRDYQAYRPDLDGKRVVAALASLAQGDCDAVEIAQGAHVGLLTQLCDSCRPEELCVYRAPFPRGPFWEMVNIDDHTGYQAVVAGTERAPAGHRRRDVEVFAAADRAYPQVGLHQHEGKKVRNAKHHTCVGAETDGCVGTTSAPLIRICALSRVTLLQIWLQVTTGRIFISLVSSCHSDVPKN